MKGNLVNQEKLVKRYLKRIIGLNEGTIVKFLITGTLALGGVAFGAKDKNTTEVVKDITLGGKEVQIKYEELKNGKLGNDTIFINGVEVEVLKHGGLLVTDKNHEVNGVNYEGLTINKDKKSGIVNFSKDGKLLFTLEKNSDNNYLIKHGGYSYIVSPDGELIFSDNPLSSGGDVPEMGVDSEFALEIEIENGLVIVDREAILKGELVNSDAGTVAVTMENSKVESHANVQISGDNSVIFKAVDSEMKNSGDLQIDGKESFGIYGENTTILNTGTINSFGMGSSDEFEVEINKGSIGIFAKGEQSYVENQGTINVKNDQSYGIRVEEGAVAVNEGVINSVTGRETLTSNGLGEWNAAMLATKKSEVINNGEIILHNDGRWVSGMIAEGQAAAINNGDITMTGNKGSAMTAQGPNGAYIENNGTILAEASGDIDNQWMVGMQAHTYLDSEIGASAVNNGSIFLNSTGLAMQGSKEAALTNNGEIIMSSISAEGTVWHDEEYATHTQYSIATGMAAADNSTAENRGTISLKGQGIAIAVRDGSTGTNSGDIELISEMTDFTYLGDEHPITGGTYTFAHGILAESGSIAINNEKGTITVDGFGYGILAEDSTGINHGMISLEARPVEEISNGNIFNGYTHVTGIDGVNSTLINETTGTIALNNYGFGIYGIEGSEIINRGKIEAEGEGIYGIYADESSVLNIGKIGIDGLNATGITAYASDVVNSGEITAYGERSIGIRGNQGSEIENSGTILAAGDGYYKNGIYADGSYGIMADSSTANNSGTIIATGISTIGLFGRYGSTVTNNVDGVIIGTGKGQFIQGADGTIIDDTTGSYGIVANDYSTGRNDGTIEMKGALTTGIRANRNSTAINNGDINLVSNLQFESYVSSNGKYYEEILFSMERGMSADRNSTGINNGTIYGEGAITGMDARRDSKVYNEGNIYVDGIVQEYAGEVFNGNDSNNIISYSRGIRARENSYGENNGTIIINGGSGEGMYSQTKSEVVNNGDIEVSSTLFETFDEDGNPITELSWLTGMRADNHSTAENNKNISIVGTGVGIRAQNNSTAINNGDIFAESKIKIEISSWIDENGNLIIREYNDAAFVSGMRAENGSYAENNGNITLSGGGSGMNSHNGGELVNNGSINVEGIAIDGGIDKFSWAAGMDIWSSIGINNGAISVTGGRGPGVYLQNGKFENTILGKIEVETIFGNGHGINGTGEVINRGIISVVKTNKDGYGYASGIDISGNVENHGLIQVEGENSRGINIYGGHQYSINNGNIHVSGNRSSGVHFSSGYFENTGKIEVEGDYSTGIDLYGYGSTAVNKGIINIDGVGSYGMFAYGGATIINGESGKLDSGIINVGASATAGMYAGYNSTAINYGTINIEAGNHNANNMVSDNLGNLISSAAMQADYMGTIKNYGEINVNSDFNINTVSGKVENTGTINVAGNVDIISSNGGAYVIGTTESGEYGKIKGDKVTIDGDVKVSANITKNGFKDEYTVQNVINAEEITYGDNFNFMSGSVLYDAEAITDRWGNLDGKLVRNDSTIADYTTGHLKAAAEILGKYHNEESYKTLSSDAKIVLKSIDTESEGAIASSLTPLVPTLYSNLGREIFEVGKLFDRYSSQTLENMGDYKFNFSIIGERAEMGSRNRIEGYRNEIGGFLGAMELGIGLYGTVGYAFNDVEYDGSSKGKIQSIQLGVKKFGEVSEFDFSLGLAGEYNFHENSREISSLNRRAESDFNSHRVGVTGELSKNYDLGQGFALKPFTSLELAYGKYESFKESGANSADAKVEGENYVSVEPKVGAKIEKKIDKNFKVYAAADYSYQLGDMDKEQKYSLAGFEGTAYLPKDELENGNTKVQIGADYSIGQFNFNINGGKEFGKRDRSFVGAGVGYKF